MAFKVSRIASSSSTSRMRRFISTPRGRIIELTCVVVLALHEMQRAATLVANEGSISPECSRYNTPVPSFYVENFGCRATQADGAAIECQLLEKGLQRASSASDASIVILNTCTVTAEADKDARAAIRRAHRANPWARILVTGCYAQRAPDEIASIPGVSVVVGNSHKHQIADIAAPPQAFVPVSAISQRHPEGASPEGPQSAPQLYISDI